MGKFATIVKLSGFALVIGISASLLLLSLPRSGWKAMTVQTGSMQPAISPGDLVLVKSVPESELKIGDVITYASQEDPKVTVTHRIIQKVRQPNGPTRLIVQGDANATPDAPVDTSQIVGATQAVVPNAGFVFDWLRTPLGLIALIYIPALFVVGAELKRLTIYYKRIKPYLMPTNEPHWRAQASGRQKLWGMTKISLFLVSISSLAMIPAWAAMTTSARLTNNTISSVATTPPNCHGNNNNNVVINNTTNQTATSGNANNSNNTNGGSATSGNASNSNNTNINVTINNC